MSFKQLAEHVQSIISEPARSKTACPVCTKETSEENCTQLIQAISDLAKKEPRWFDFFYKGDENEAFQSLASGDYGWACDACLKSGAAILANPNDQTFCDWPPYLAYVDENKTCKTCSEEFVFSKEEQFYWYETLKFWVQSRAKDCRKCRKSARESKKVYASAQAEAQKLKSELDVNSIYQLERLIELYEKTGSNKQIERYSNTLKNLKKLTT